MCGGSANSPPYAFVMKRLLEQEGVPSDRIWVEPRSRNTHESAIYGADVLKQHGIARVALVIEAAGINGPAMLQLAGEPQRGVHQLLEPEDQYAARVCGECLCEAGCHGGEGVFEAGAVARCEAVPAAVGQAAGPAEVYPGGQGVIAVVVRVQVSGGLSRSSPRP